MRMSFPIFIRETAVRLSADDISTIASLEARASNLLFAATNGKWVKAAIFSATNSAYPFGAFNPVPTAVPPNASSEIPFNAVFSARMAFSICAA